MEFHGITNDGWGWSNVDKRICLAKLANTHYIIHAHGNNHSFMLNDIPDVIELTFVNKKYFNSIPELNKQNLPIENIDFRNTINNDEINLNHYPFNFN
jgi:hypothetical protein